jgi:hypothetical protein
VKTIGTNPGSPESLFSCGISGSQAATWIGEYKYQFSVYPATGCAKTDRTSTVALASILVEGKKELIVGACIAFHCNVHNRFIRMHGGDMDASGHMAASSLPGGWTWERFKVVDAGNGQLAFHNSVHNRFMRMNNNRDMDGSGTRAANQLPTGWTWERFTVVSAGNGQAALHNKVHNRFVRLNGGGADASGTAGDNQLPTGWTWERFTPVRC